MKDSRTWCRAALAILGLTLLVCRAAAQGPTTADCDRSVNHCTNCRYQFFRGTTTKALCTRCEVGYVVRSFGLACYCAPGYYTNESTSVTGSVGFTCQPCGSGFFCPGGRVTAASSSVRVSCGANKLTTTDYAQSDLECVVQPGYGWGPADNSSICDVGSYNPGYNARQCTPCPGGLTTLGPGATSSLDCLAAAGSYYLRGKAVACARGTYKNFTGNEDCGKCPIGITTPNGTVAADTSFKCTVLLPGYRLAANPTLGRTAAEECAPNTYRSDEIPFDSSSNATSCSPCPNGLVTLPNVTRSTTVDACVAPPGYGWSPGAGSPAGQATICAVGTYNPGYNRQPCTSCGNGLLTDTAGAINADACFTLPGWGNVKDTITGFYNASICPIGTYGRSNNTYGLVDVSCTKCMDHATTNFTGATSQSQCLVEPGYGWADGQVLECKYGYYNEGYNQKLCTYCGDGYNTSVNANATAGEYRATNASQCRIDFGYWRGASGGIESCLRGFYKDTLGPQACTTCPAGTSTTKAQAGLKVGDCDTCKPGFGVSGGKIANLSAPICGRCASGTYSSGFNAGGQACGACPQAANFTGRMVSRPGISTPEDCYGEFDTSRDVFDNQQAWDLIPMDLGVTLALQPSLLTVEACQDACSASDDCQYFAFYKTGGPQAYNGGNSQCYFRLAGAISPLTAAAVGSWDAPSVALVAFEARGGQYVVYPAVGSEQVGVPLAAAPQGLLPAKSACDADRNCVGLRGGASGWTLFGAVQRADAIGKIRVVGENIQAWVPWPTGL